MSRQQEEQPVAPGWRIDPILSRGAYEDEDGQTRIPVSLTRNGQHIAVVEMVLPPTEAKALADGLAGVVGNSRSVLHSLFPGRAVALAPGVVLVPKDASGSSSWT